MNEREFIQQAEKYAAGKLDHPEIEALWTEMLYKPERERILEILVNLYALIE